jgi:hypothetical protein
MLLVIVAVGIGAWALGRTQTDGGPGPGGGGSPPHGEGTSQSNGHMPGQGASGGTSGMPGGSAPPPKPSWQRTNPGPGTAGANTAKGGWEKAREETKKREEERKAAEAARKKKEDDERKLKEAREKDAREREEREKRLKEMREAREKKEAETKAKGSTYAFSAVGEKTNPWPRGAPPAAAGQPRSQPATPTKRPPPPTAKTYLGTEDDAYSFRPYDKPSKPLHKKSASSIYSEESYAASHSTSRTTPPPSHRGPYSTKDPDKIVIKAVYSFTNAFLRTPTSQLVSGVGSVTDGLILRITTEGLFIDDDVRGVPQREWDVKAWTMKLVEVWCPNFSQGPAGNSARNSRTSASATNPVRRLWNMEKDKAATAEEADALLVNMLQTCKDTCRHLSDSAYASDFAASTSSPGMKNSNRYHDRQTGELKTAGLHVLRASIRDQEGKRYVFVVNSEESWKVAVGLQRLRRGTQVRALGVSSMSSADARTTLENLGWG